jgi:FtsP/CotA-like multicopper oxidase with cupredoxin domain
VRTFSFLFTGALLVVAGPVLADELQPPVVIAATPGATPPQPPHGCPPVPHLTGGVTVATVNVQRAARDIGPFSVPLDGYVIPGSPPSYSPFLIKADPGGSLVMDFVVDPSVGAVVSNLHTHGLIVKPRPVLVPHASAPCPAGDYIFIRTGPAEAGVGGGDPPHQPYRIDIPETLPAAFLGRSASPKPTGSAPYPAGLYWMHAHLHGVARPQVTEGMSALLSVGDEKDSIASMPQSVQDLTDVRYLALRDIQLLTTPCPPKRDSQGGVVKDNKGAVVADCGTAPPLETIPPNTPGEDAGELYNSGMCDGTTSGKGWCAGHVQIPNTTTNVYAYWLFTVTGQLDPTITVPHGRNHLWRVANLSANVSYVLKLCAADADKCDKSSDRQPLTVVSVDGVQAGSRSALGGTTALGVRVDRLLMMPGSRAAFFVRNDDASNVPPGKWQLRTSRFDTGPGPVIAGVNGETGDTWPKTVLADVNVEGAPQSSALVAQERANPATTTPIPRVMQAQSTSIGRDPESRPECSFLPRDDAAHSYRRQIIFDEDNANSIFRLGSQRVDQNGGLVADNRNIAPTEFAHGGAYSGDDFPPGLHVCATLHRGEVWELINTTDELHNFHIHQGKFRLARKGDPGMPESQVDSFQDPFHLLDGLVAEGSSVDPSVDLWHDTFPVPPKKGNVNGRVFIYIPFEAEEQLGRFVFHCHILEHEDHGMMAAVEVVRQTPDKDENSTTPSSLKTPMHKSH